MEEKGGKKQTLEAEGASELSHRVAEEEVTQTGRRRRSAHSAPFIVFCGNFPFNEGQAGHWLTTSTTNKCLLTVKQFAEAQEELASCVSTVSLSPLV